MVLVCPLSTLSTLFFCLLLRSWGSAEAEAEVWVLWVQGGVQPITATQNIVVFALSRYILTELSQKILLSWSWINVVWSSASASLRHGAVYSAGDMYDLSVSVLCFSSKSLALVFTRGRTDSSLHGLKYIMPCFLLDLDLTLYMLYTPTMVS